MAVTRGEAAVLGRELGEPAMRRPRWYAHRFNRVGPYHVAATVGAALPRPVRLRLAAAIAPRLRGLFTTEWQVVVRSMARIVPQAGEAAWQALAAGGFSPLCDVLHRPRRHHFAMCFTDLVVTNRHRGLDALLAGLEGSQHMVAAVQRERGLIVLTGHLGNWELEGRLMTTAVARPTHVVVEAERDPEVERFLRGGPGPLRFVARRSPTDVLSLVTALRRGEVVAMQGDRALGDRGDATVPFFGAPARFPLGPFILARASGAPVIPAFCLLDEARRYVISLGNPIEVEAGGEDAALRHWVTLLEEMVRAHPAQWFNFFDCWSMSSAS
jgi:lauroyl/myristoyl acyltransferase